MIQSNLSQDQFDNIATLRKDLSFRNCTYLERNNHTHSYHYYPARFIPPVILKIIDEYTKEGDMIWDPFCGSGTLNVEAYHNQVHSVGTDINPTSVLIARAKTTPIDPSRLAEFRSRLFRRIHAHEPNDLRFYFRNDILNGNAAELRSWYSEETLHELSHLLYTINEMKAPSNLNNFALCCFSSILQRTSIWLRTSVKPQKDHTKVPDSPQPAFIRQFKMMERANERFYDDNHSNGTFIRIIKHDAKYRLPVRLPQEYDAIITSPPYLVSYEYGDLFRLPYHFLFYQNDFDGYKTSFIGTKRRKSLRDSEHLRGIDFLSNDLLRNDAIDDRLKRAILNYYIEMSRFMVRSKQHLVQGGKLILLVGDTNVRALSIPNTYILSQLAGSIGFSIEDVFKRETSGKNLPSYRDPVSGKFVSKDAPNRQLIHNEEYILVLNRE